jgi:hypothetical protein
MLDLTLPFEVESILTRLLHLQSIAEILHRRRG